MQAVSLLAGRPNPPCIETAAGKRRIGWQDVTDFHGGMDDMIGKRAIAIAAGLGLMLAAASGPALAHGFGRHGGPDHNMWLLAHAAGLNGSQIASAFHNDANLKTDHTNLRNAHEALMSCLVSGKECTSEVSAFSSAVQAMAQERMTVWATLFKSAPNPSQAASVYSQLQQLQSQRKQIFHSVFGSQPAEDGSAGSAAPSNG